MGQPSSLSLVARLVSCLIAMCLLLILPAGDWYWVEAYVFIAMFLIFFVANMAYFGRHDPSLFKKRSKMKPEKEWDLVFTVFSGAMFFALLVLSGLDAVRFGWSDIPLYLEVAGFVLVSISLAGVFLVMKENTYLFRIVKVVKGQKVIETGPYSVVRHPMYSSFMVMMIGLPLALGSYYSFIPSLLVCLSIVFRTVKEDETLQKELSGYKAYTKKTRYKLIPGIW